MLGLQLIKTTVQRYQAWVSSELQSVRLFGVRKRAFRASTDLSAPGRRSRTTACDRRWWTCVLLPGNRKGVPGSVAHSSSSLRAPTRGWKDRKRSSATVRRGSGTQGRSIQRLPSPGGARETCREGPRTLSRGRAATGPRVIAETPTGRPGTRNCRHVHKYSAPTHSASTVALVATRAHSRCQGTVDLVPDSRPPRWLNRLALRASVFPRRPPCVLQPPDRDCVAG